MSTEVQPYTDEQTAALTLMAEAINAFTDALRLCGEVGIQPVDALRAIGIEVPGFASGMLNSSLTALTLPAEITSAEDLQS